MAAAARMFGGEAIPTDCRRCLREPDFRTAMGCDVEAARPVWYAQCDCGKDPSCSDCGGSGRRGVKRCPSAIVGNRADIGHVMRAWLQYDSRHVLPCAGAWIDQTAQFTDAVELIDVERAYWHAETERHRESKRRSAANASIPRRGKA